MILIRENYNIIQKFAHFSKSCTDFQYHFVGFNYVIHLKMSITSQHVFNITTSYGCFALLHYIIHCRALAPAIFEFHGLCCTPCCTLHQHEHEVPHCHVQFHYQCCFLL
jgi:hypothetical protein